MFYLLIIGRHVPKDKPLGAAPAEYRGIGIRIEDAVLITDGAPEVLTAACPKQRRDLEASPATQPTTPTSS